MEKVIASVEGSIGCAGRGSVTSGLASVSATVASASPANATISPANASSIGCLSKPLNAKIFVIRPTSMRSPFRLSA